uniref:Subtilisin-like protease SBT1.7 n=1 Tax=Ananas comosus var. bracteatus TaxID=296719 RepID=A0A6V7P8M3_ANACO|nr:unnamed protein product [Ananas comosus var. bracteatus]
MAKPFLLLALSIVVFALLFSETYSEQETRSTYIVHVSPAHAPPQSSSSPALLRRAYSCALGSMLPERLRRPRPRLLYGRTPPLPSFLRLSASSGLWPLSHFASSAVVAVLDTGIWPSRPSFSDADSALPPPPRRGAAPASPPPPSTPPPPATTSSSAPASSTRATRPPWPPHRRVQGVQVPLDTEGHGTHTASTAAGAAVKGAGFYGYARGVAQGVATAARVAAYKICWASGCFDSDILAAMDAAIADGADVISLSVGANGYAPPFHRDSIAIGAFGAARRGVVVSCSAGTPAPAPTPPSTSRPGSSPSAPPPSTASSPPTRRSATAPPTAASRSTPASPERHAPAARLRGRLRIAAVHSGRPRRDKVAGKIVLCDRGLNARVEKGSAVKIAGGAAMILANTEENGEELIADSHLIPATMVAKSPGTRFATTSIRRHPHRHHRVPRHGHRSIPAGAQSGVLLQPRPNYRAREILKPDVIAPGSTFWPPGPAPAARPIWISTPKGRIQHHFRDVHGVPPRQRHRRSPPHGPPEWSPAAVKSAIMTTAYNLDNSGETIRDLATGEESTPFVRGAGHVDPNSALDPGLLYDAQVDDYIAFLCSIGYTADQIAVFTRDGSTANCSTTTLSSPGDLNYPAFSVLFSSHSDVVTYRRVVRNVGSSADAVYEVAVCAPRGVNVTVSPSRLEFNSVGQSLSYEVTFASAANPVIVGDNYAFGSILWADGSHNVRSPVAVTWPASLVSSS